MMTQSVKAGVPIPFQYIFLEIAHHFCHLKLAQDSTYLVSGKLIEDMILRDYLWGLGKNTSLL